MDMFNLWREYFQNWPEGVPVKGVVVTRLNDQIPFIGYLASESILMLERPAPDTTGARRVLMPYGEIHAVKLTEVFKAKVLEAAGFHGQLPKGL